MESAIKEVFSDFKNSLAGINFSSYNPNSPEFMAALNVGLMWHLLNELSENGTDIKAAMSAMEDEYAEKDEISDELYGAKKYYQKFIDGGDSAYKDLAKDELRHAEILIKKANAKLPSGDEKAKLKEYEAELKEISSLMTE